MSAIKNAAIKFAHAGMSVIPLGGYGEDPPKWLIERCDGDVDKAREKWPKTPRLKWEEFKTRAATPEEVAAWFKRWPGANFALVTGQVSGIIAVDVDGHEGAAWAEANLPRTGIYNQTAKGFHALFRVNGTPVKNAVRIAPQVDVRGDGGYIVMAPSVHPTGRVYELHNPYFPDKDGWANLAPFHWPTEAPQGHESPSPSPSHGLEKIGQGGRNDALTRMAGRWFGKRLDPDEVVLLALAWNRDYCDPPLAEGEVRRTVESIAKRERNKSDGSYESYESYESDASAKIVSNRTESYGIVSNRTGNPTENHRRFDGNLTAEIEEWIKNSTGSFTVADVDREFGLTLQADKRRRSDALRACARKNKIQKDRRITGKYHVVETEAEWIDLTAVDEASFPLELPLGLTTMVTIPPKAVIVVAGTTNSGKTAFMLNALRLNFDQDYGLAYIMSEMGPSEYKQRVRLFGDPVEDWASRVKAASKSSGFDGLITHHNPNGLTVVDFLEEIEGEYYKIASDIRTMYDALGNGVVMIGIQKKSGGLYGRGGEATAEKARLYLSIDTMVNRDRCSVCAIRIVKCKNYPDGKNPNGKELHFKIERGHKLTALSDWIYCNDKQREQYIKRYEKMLDTAGTPHWGDR